MGNTFRFLGEVLMPWRDCSVMEERLRFVARHLEGEPMMDLCREFGISRKAGYNIRTGTRQRDLDVAEGNCFGHHHEKPPSDKADLDEVDCFWP
jgi:hypothetical protein